MTWNASDTGSSSGTGDGDLWIAIPVRIFCGAGMVSQLFAVISGEAGARELGPSVAAEVDMDVREGGEG